MDIIFMRSHATGNQAVTAVRGIRNSTFKGPLPDRLICVSCARVLFEPCDGNLWIPVARVMENFVEQVARG